MPTTVINGHRTGLPNDANEKLYVEGSGGVVGGVHDTYRVAHNGGPGSVEIAFMSAERPGLTNEVLLAILSDRLRGFQGGPFKCEENAVALSHLGSAMAALQERTRRLHLTANRPQPRPGRVVREAYTVWVGGKAFDVDEPDKVRAAIAALDPPLRRDEIPDNLIGTKAIEDFLQQVGTKMAEDAKAEAPRVRMEGDLLFIGSGGFTPDSLKEWKNWNQVESMCKRLDPPLTPAELETIEKAASHLGGGARNGLAEFKSAMASTRKA